MLTIDAQVHAYERNHPGRPWVGTLTGPAEVTGDQMVAAMDAVGVDGAILVSPFSMYRYDASYAKQVYRAHPGRLDQAGGLAARNPNTQLVIDHLGLPQPQVPPAPPEPFAALPQLLALAVHQNIAVKISGACTLSHEQFPYRDIWDPLRRVFDAFGFKRCMWGTDWTRAVNLLSYEQGVKAFRITDRLSDGEKTALMGEALSKIYNWSPAKA
jgi:predicted TIM-barrel fold metal-dependent hydrolase